MKKLLDIIKLQPLNDCYQLELDFKTERHNLKRYLKSLKEMKTRTKLDFQFFANSVKTSSNIIDEQSTIKKKNSELDYYLVNGVKLFKAINMEARKMENFYDGIHTQAKELTERIIKYLDQSKESFTRVSSEHQKSVKDYAEKCYPDTTTILYMLGFVNSEKIKKVEDSMKEQGLMKETEMYAALLNTYLDQMENLKAEATRLCKDFYTGASELWLACNGQIQQEVQGYEVKEDEIELYYKETGGAMTDRSDRSNRENQQEDEHVEDI